MQQYDESYFQQSLVQKDKSVLQTYIDLLPSNQLKSIQCLDIGCGSGYLLELLQQHGYLRTFGVDIGLAALKLDKQKGLDVVQASADISLPFADQTFGLIFFLDVIEHLHNPYKALLEIHRVLKKDGSLVLTTPNAGSFMRQLLGQRWYALRDETHLYYFGNFSLTYLLAKAGFVSHKKYTYSKLSLSALSFIFRITGQGGQLVVLARKAQER